MTRKPYKLIVTNDPERTLGEGRIRHFATLLPAANAMVRDPAPYKTIIFDEGCVARELSRREKQMLEHVAGMLGYDIEEP